MTEIARRFLDAAKGADVRPYGSGHIHDTYLVTPREAGERPLILQRINTRVFRKPLEVMENLERVTRHMRRKLGERPGSDPDRECLTIVRSTDGELCHVDPQGGYWRAFLFIPDSLSYDLVSDPQRAFTGGSVYGRFLSLLADLPGPPLHETIPHFHDIERRLETFRRVVQADRVGRSGEAREQIDFALARAEEMTRVLRLGREGRLPVRTTHNDTKFNNVLLDKDDKGLCAIDLDTVMPGYVAYDFGDAVRTGTNTGAEDDPDLDRVGIDLTLYEAYARGYLSETASLLDLEELDSLPFGGKLMAYTMGLRFLTDHLDGDTYYKIHFPGHNLRRARAQFRLLTSMEKSYEEMHRIARAAYAEARRR